MEVDDSQLDKLTPASCKRINEAHPFHPVKSLPRNLVNSHHLPGIFLFMVPSKAKTIIPHSASTAGPVGKARNKNSLNKDSSACIDAAPISRGGRKAQNRIDLPKHFINS
jgi:hypothetical protein